MTPTAERALDYARHELMDAGNPAWTAVAVLPDRSCDMGVLIVAAPHAANAAAGALASAHPEAEVLLVGCESEGKRLRFTVMHAGTGRRVLRRDEVREEALGDQQML